LLQKTRFLERLLIHGASDTTTTITRRNAALLEGTFSDVLVHARGTTTITTTTMMTPTMTTMAVTMTPTMTTSLHNDDDVVYDDDDAEEDDDDDGDQGPCLTTTVKVETTVTMLLR
jgi:hypothetical protein